MLKRLLSLAVLILMVGLGAPVIGGQEPRILLLGDSMMAANRFEGQAVSDVLEKALGQQVVDHSVVGARYFFFLPIAGEAGLRLPAQYRGGGWQWVVMNGGGNDLLFGCGCGKCARMLDRLVSKDGRHGAIPELVARIRLGGAKVIYTGYLRNPGTSTPIKGCKPAGDELDRRLALMSAFDDGVTFVSLAGIVPYGDLSYHGADRIHPSAKGSRAIGNLIAQAMAK